MSGDGYEDGRGQGLDQGRTPASRHSGLRVVYDANRGERTAHMIDYGQGRACSECGAKLNRYNPGPGCSLHPNATGEPAGRHVCPTCNVMRDAVSFVRANGYVNKRCGSCCSKRYGATG